MDYKFIIYGAGKKGKWIYDFLEWRKLDDKICCFVDINYSRLEKYKKKKVLSLQEAIGLEKNFLIAIENQEVARNVKLEIEKLGGKAFLYNEMYKVLNEESHVYYREWCAYHHATSNDTWFKQAEEKAAVDIFWGENSLFLNLFNKLDLKKTIEIACGWGRHVPYYLDRTGEITLVDILEENIVLCKERFKDTENIVYYKNNGFNLDKLSSEAYTSVFSYDSMVHFELFDVYEYLRDIYRVLVPGGRALLHHSNYSKDYEVNFTTEPHARCFMDKQVFAYMASRVGFSILNQEVIDWNGVKELDCITLLEK